MVVLVVIVMVVIVLVVVVCVEVVIVVVVVVMVVFVIIIFVLLVFVVVYIVIIVVVVAVVLIIIIIIVVKLNLFFVMGKRRRENSYITGFKYRISKPNTKSGCTNKSFPLFPSSSTHTVKFTAPNKGTEIKAGTSWLHLELL